MNHTIYYQFGSTKFKLETNSPDLDDYFDQFNMLEVKHIDASDFDNNLIEKVIKHANFSLSHYNI